jgi:hypothetical protein
VVPLKNILLASRAYGPRLISVTQTQWNAWLILSTTTTCFRKTECMSSWMASMIGLTKFEVIYYRYVLSLGSNKRTLMSVGKLADKQL